MCWLEAWNVSDGWLQQNTMMDVLSAALTLNMSMANSDRIQMAGLAQAVNVISRAAWWVLLLVNCPLGVFVGRAFCNRACLCDCRREPGASNPSVTMSRTPSV